jgi:hypothetical protein
MGGRSLIGPPTFAMANEQYFFLYLWEHRINLDPLYYPSLLKTKKIMKLLKK